MGAIRHQKRKSLVGPSLTQRDSGRLGRFVTTISVGTGHSAVSDFGSLAALKIDSRPFYAPDSNGI